jgi:fatty acid-binding protein DegV
MSGLTTAHPMVAVQLGPVVGAHTGPNTVGLCYIVADSSNKADG